VAQSNIGAMEQDNETHIEDEFDYEKYKAEKSGAGKMQETFPGND
jgi:hypothetical protein